MKFLAVVCVLIFTLYSSSSSQSTALYIYSGEDRTPLGCLNCYTTSSDSVCNSVGKHGSPFRSESIWNEFGAYGSQYRNTSPWNSYATKAPIIVDARGGSYGHLSINSYHRNVTRVPWLQNFLSVAEKMKSVSSINDFYCSMFR
jgi:hypothetical protein